jgi:hypothetical protein
MEINIVYGFSLNNTNYNLVYIYLDGNCDQLI